MLIGTSEESAKSHMLFPLHCLWYYSVSDSCLSQCQVFLSTSNRKRFYNFLDISTCPKSKSPKHLLIRIFIKPVPLMFKHVCLCLIKHFTFLFHTKASNRVSPKTVLALNTVLFHTFSLSVAWSPASVSPVWSTFCLASRHVTSVIVILCRGSDKLK